MKTTKTALLSAAVAGLLFGTVSCKKEEAVTPPAGNAAPKDAPKDAPAGNAQAALEKHACAKLNTCKNNGKSAKNECAGKGDCATVAKHECGTKNDCKMQGGCKTGDKGCAGKNTCKGKGGCAVPVKH